MTPAFTWTSGNIQFIFKEDDTNKLADVARIEPSKLSHHAQSDGSIEVTVESTSTSYLAAFRDRVFHAKSGALDEVGVSEGLLLNPTVESIHAPSHAQAFSPTRVLFDF